MDWIFLLFFSAPTYMVTKNHKKSRCSRVALRVLYSPRHPHSRHIRDLRPAGGSVSQVLHREGPMPESLIACYAMQLLEVANLFQRGSGGRR